MKKETTSVSRVSKLKHIERDIFTLIDVCARLSFLRQFNDKLPCALTTVARKQHAGERLKRYN